MTALVNPVWKRFSPKARWIWDKSDRFSENYYLRAKQSFWLTENDLRRGQKKVSQLFITADAHYQVWLNGKMLGHGPAKSPSGERFVDSYEVGQFLISGENTMEVLVLSIGLGTMNYCLGEAGLIFELQAAGHVIVSDSQTSVQRDTRRSQKTARRWFMPHLEAIDARKSSDKWSPAEIVKKTCRLLPRPVPLPSRTEFSPSAFVAKQSVRLPNFSWSFRVKPYLVPTEQLRRSNEYAAPAIIISDLISPQAQSLEWYQAPGQVTWYLNGKEILTASGWSRGDGFPKDIVLPLKKGANRLIGLHPNRDYFDYVHLAGYSEFPIDVRNPVGAGGFQIIPVPEVSDSLLPDIPSILAKTSLPEMNPDHTLKDGVLQDMLVNARLIASHVDHDQDGSHAWSFSPPPAGHAERIIVDLGAVQMGWVSFTAHGSAAGRFVFSFFEALEFEPPLAINWPGALNNCFAYTLGDGVQRFESFLSYGARYVAIQYEGVKPATISNLKLHASYCGKLQQGAFRSSSLLLDSIYSLCTQTLLSSTDDTFTDCPTYEAVNWNFDNRLATMADLVTFRNLPIIRNSIIQFTRDSFYPGLVRSQYPSDWENRIPVFCFHWMIVCWEFYQHTKDIDFVKTVFPQIENGLAEAMTMIDKNGLLTWPDSDNPMHVIDWHLDRDDWHPVASAEQAMLVGGLRAGERLAQILGKQDLVGRWNTAQKDLKNAIHKALWQPERDAYADSLHKDGQLSSVSSKTSNAVLATYGIGTKAWRQRLVERIAADDPDLLTFGSPMGLFYVFEFLDECGDVETLFHLIEGRWGPMLAAGDKTAWEMFPEYQKERFPTRSRCHPFSTYILKYYVKYVLGIHFTDQGPHNITFRPNPPSWIQHANGAVPTENGIVHVGWKRANGRITGNATLPSGIELLSK